MSPSEQYLFFVDRLPIRMVVFLFFLSRFENSDISSIFFSLSPISSHKSILIIIIEKQNVFYLSMPVITLIRENTKKQHTRTLTNFESKRKKRLGIPVCEKTSIERR